MSKHHQPGWSLGRPFDRAAAISDLGGTSQRLAALARVDDGSDEHAAQCRELGLIVGRISARLRRHPGQ